MKKTIATITSIFIVIVFSALPARADRKTMEGFLLGTGVAILGTVLYHGMNKNDTPQYQSSYSQDKKYNHAGYRNKHQSKRKYDCRSPRGYWSVERVWIKPVYKKKWNPGHYNRHGERMGSRYKKILVSNGYWHKEKRWVKHEKKRRVRH